MFFPNKTALEYDLSCIIGKDDISFSRKYDLTTSAENETWSFSKKDTLKYDTFFKISEKIFFPKGSALAYDLSCINWKDGIFFQKHDNFSLRRSGLSQEIHGNMTFSMYTHGCYKRGATHLCQKNQRWSYPAKIHLKVIDVLDWHPRKSSSNSLYFHGDPYRRFHALLSSKEKQET